MTENISAATTRAKSRRPRRSRLALLAALGALAMLAPAAPAAAAERPLAERPLPVIRVQGQGEIAIAPDMAIVGLGVLREAMTARQALTANNEAMAEVIAAMKEEGIAARDLQTSGFSIQPRYVHPPRKPSGETEPPRIVGYSVSNNLSVKIRDLAKLGAVLDRAVTLGVNTGSGISFGNAEPEQFIEKARQAAMKDAASRAGTLAEAAGVRLGQLLEVTESYNDPRPVPMLRGKMMAEAMAADAVPVEAGESTYTVNVQASWEILQ